VQIWGAAIVRGKLEQLWILCFPSSIAAAAVALFNKAKVYFKKGIVGAPPAVRLLLEGLLICTQT